MEIIVQKNVSTPSTRKIFAQLSTETLTLKDIILSLRSIIDDEKNGYYRLPLLTARGEGLQRLDFYTSLRKERADKAIIISNGRKHSIYMLDYVMKARRVYHDPILCIIGPEAEYIAEHTLKKLSKILLSKIYRVELNYKAISDFSNLMGYGKREVIKYLSEIFKEADMTLKMRLLKENSEDEEPRTYKHRLSEELFREIEMMPSFSKSLDLRNIVSFGATIILMVLLLIILMRI